MFESHEEGEITAQDVLDRAFVIIHQNEIARGAYAQDADGDSVYTDSLDAVAFDPAGAIYRAASELGITAILHNHVYREAFSHFQTHVRAHYPCPALVTWGDRVSDGEIREMFRRASNPLVVLV